MKIAKLNTMFVSLALALLATPALAEPCGMVDLGTLGGTYASAVEINDHGQVLGRSYLAGNTSAHAVLWQDGHVIDLGTLGGANSTPKDMNKKGHVVGTAQTASGEWHAFFWKEGAMIDLGTLGGNSSEALFINERGDVAGNSKRADGKTHAFLWRDGTMVDLGSLDDESQAPVGLQRGYSYALGLNEKGQVFGSSMLSGWTQHGFFWDGGAMIDLGSLGGTGYRDIITPKKMNDKGQIIGSAYTASGESHAFLWEGGTMIDLGTLGGRRSQAMDINEHGQIVGHSAVPFADPSTPWWWSQDEHAFLWENGAMIDLGTLGGDSSDAYLINEDGLIAGISERSDGSYHAFTWQDGEVADVGSLGVYYDQEYGYSDDYSRSLALNDRGQLIGRSTSPESSSRGFLAEDGSIIDLGSLGGSSVWPSAINKKGQIVGQASLPGDAGDHVFLYTPEGQGCGHH